jgi:hypothetical protein
VQSSESILGPVQQTATPAAIVTPPDPVDDKQQEQQQKSEEKQASEGDSDDAGEGSADANLGLINTNPMQPKGNFEQPVTSGGMDTMMEIPGDPN